MFAVQINTNDRENGRPQFVKALYGDHPLEVADRIEKFGAPDVARWVRNNTTFIEEVLVAERQDVMFCGDNGEYRFDMQLADGRGA